MATPINILYVSHTPEPKGSAMSLAQIITGVDKTRYVPVVAFSKEGPLIAKLREQGVKAFVLKKRGPLGVGLVREASALIASERIGLVHLNSAVPFCKYIGIAARLKGIPVVWHIREDPEGKRVRSLKRWVSLLSDRILVVSSDLDDFFRSTGKAVKLYNGVDITRFRPGLDGRGFRGRFGIPEGAFVFGMVGTIEPRKGNIMFLESARELLVKGLDARFVIVGTGLAEHVVELEGFIKADAALDGKVILTGRLDDVPEALAGMDALVMPSSWEGFPRALIEAMAAGLPAVATDVGEVRHIMVDGVTGYVIAKDDRPALTAAMERLMVERDRLPGMGLAARGRVEGFFTMGKSLAAVTGVYDELTGGVAG